MVSRVDITKYQNQQWDVIIVGSGMGGSTLAYCLAQEGVRVLVLEKGSPVLSVTPPEKVSTEPQARQDQGWWPQPLSRWKSPDQFEEVYAAIGCGAGGSTLQYAAALERMAASDFKGLKQAGVDVPDWPISFEEFEHFYHAAEQLYGVANDNDIAWESRISQWDKEFLSNLKRAGLNPERLRVGIKYDPGCKECIGVVCLRNCKFDSKMACLDKAVATGRCEILFNCEVQSLAADSVGVNKIVALTDERAVELRAKIYVLSAGAMSSPQILLASANRWWPNGLANRSGLVGRNLMFHGVDIYAIWAPRKLERKAVQKKSISIRDFYLQDRASLGYIQSMGLSAGSGVISMFIKAELRKFGIQNAKLLSVLAKIPAALAARLFGDAGLFAAQIEDYPSVENRIALDAKRPNATYFVYTMSDELRARAERLKTLFAKKIGKWRLVRITPQVDINTGHPCGTCRFGVNASNSVLNSDCRAHDVNNLYIVDASFFPRSAAVNPSLTIAANAIRVSRKISEHLRRI